MTPADVMREALQTIKDKPMPVGSSGYSRYIDEVYKIVVAALSAPVTPTDVMRDALKQWKCPGCGGRGTYQQDAAGRARASARGAAIDPKYQPDPVTCKVCKGDGLNPIASAALNRASPAVAAEPLAQCPHYSVETPHCLRVQYAAPKK